MKRLSTPTTTIRHKIRGACLAGPEPLLRAFFRAVAPTSNACHVSHNASFSDCLCSVLTSSSMLCEPLLMMACSELSVEQFRPFRDLGVNGVRVQERVRFELLKAQVRARSAWCLAKSTYNILCLCQTLPRSSLFVLREALPRSASAPDRVLEANWSLEGCRLSAPHAAISIDPITDTCLLLLSL